MSCESKINQAGLVWNVVEEQDVIWLEIPMNGPMYVNVAGAGGWGTGSVRGEDKHGGDTTI
jgi:hypothetical protein